MAIFNLKKQNLVSELKQEFNDAFGAKLRIYVGRSQINDNAVLSEAGLIAEGTFECRSSLTCGRFIERMQEEFGLKVKVYTCDEWVAVLDGLTLESAGKVKKNAVKADMESMIAYQRTENEVAPAAECAAPIVDIKKSVEFNGYIINIYSNNSVKVLRNGEECANSKGTLQEIAALIDFEINASWTTQQLGAKLVAALNNDTTAARSESIQKLEENIRLETEKIIAEKVVEKTQAKAEVVNKTTTDNLNIETEKNVASKNVSSTIDEECCFCDVVLKKAGPERLKVIMTIKEACDLGLREAKEMVVGAPTIISANCPIGFAKRLKTAIEYLGADVELIYNTQQIKYKELLGEFCINEKGEKICFSRGNLQFNPTLYQFRFSPIQHYTVLCDNEMISPNYNGWIDLFGWGTSGYMGCQPSEISLNHSEYGPSLGDITGTNYDWGVYNPIINGGNKKGIWRTPTKDEWDYLMNKRPNADKLKSRCCIEGQYNCNMLMPDNFWDNRIGISIDTTTDNYETNSYNYDQLLQLEDFGVVFIPLGGTREGSSYKKVGSGVWLATNIDYHYAYCGRFKGSEQVDKCVGCSVRLIRDI